MDFLIYRYELFVQQIRHIQDSNLILRLVLIGDSHTQSIYTDDLMFQTPLPMTAR